MLTRIPRKVSLNFSDFSTSFYGFYKFQFILGFEEKRKLKGKRIPIRPVGRFSARSLAWPTAWTGFLPRHRPSSRSSLGQGGGPGGRELPAARGGSSGTGSTGAARGDRFAAEGVWGSSDLAGGGGTLGGSAPAGLWSRNLHA
jgi:hypothetical protein